MTNLINGALYPFRALGTLLRTPRLWGYVVVPIVLNLVVAVALYGALLVVGLQGIDRLVADTALGAALSAALRVLLIVGLLIVIGFVLVRFGVVLGSPWYGKLSEQLEQMRTGRAAPPAEPLNPAGIARDLARAVGFELKKLALVLFVGLLLLLINLVPVAGQVISTVGGFALGATIACLDFLDGPLERRRLGFRQKLGAIRRMLPASAGFGLVSLGLVSIPLLNLISIPLCVTAGTLFFCDLGPRQEDSPK